MVNAIIPLKKRNIPLLLICTPDTALSTSPGYYNTVENPARANGIALY